MKKIGRGLSILFFVLILWQVLAMLLHSPVLPHPTSIIENFFAAISGSLPLHIGYSMIRISLSIFFSILVGLPLGIAIGYSDKLSRLLSPFLYLSYPIPKLALLPIIMLLFGLGEISKIIIIFLILFFPITVEIANSVRAMNKEIFETMQAFGVSETSIARHVIMPGILPSVLGSLKVSLGIALSILFFAENYGTQFGLGYYIMNSWQKMDYTELYTGILTLSLLGFILFLFIDFIEDKVSIWK